MDETGINFDLSGDATVGFIGTKRVSMVKNYASESRFACVLTISGNGKFLKLMIIFKGKNKLINIVDEGIEVFVHENAWMNISLMKQYITLLPVTNETKLLIMDSFVVHKNQEIINLLQVKNYKVIFVSPGYTDLFQPLDVGIMKPMKSIIRNFFQEWLFNNRIVDGKVKVLSKNFFCQWVTRTLREIRSSSIKNSFRAAHVDLECCRDFDYEEEVIEHGEIECIFDE